MAYKDLLIRLADDSEHRVTTIYQAFLDGLLSHDETVQMIASYLVAANGQAIALADLAYAAEVMTQLGEAVPVARSSAAGDLERLSKAATTVLTVAEASPVPDAIVRRLGRSEPLESAANAYSDAMIRSGKTKGWVRQKSANACQLCTWWWREGRVWPAEHKFQHHKGCTCTPKPVIAEGIRETWTTARAKGIR